MRDLGLTVRMVIASTVLMAVYALVGVILFGVGGIWTAVLGLPLLVAAQYFVTVQLPLWTEENQEITRQDFPELHERADRLAEELGIAKPTMYLVEEDTMNARALGRRGSGKVFLSRKLIQRMSIDELEPIVAHEFAHLKNRDSVLMGLGVSIVSLISSMLLVMFFLVSLDSERPWLVRAVGAIVSVCVHFFLLIFVMVLSRYREYIADEEAVRVSGQYEGMRSALEKLRLHKQRIENSGMSARRGAISFVDFSGGIASRLFSTHPTLDNRIARIEDLESQASTSKTTPSASRENSSDTTNAPAASALAELSDQQLISELQSMDEYSFERLIGDLWSEIGWQTTVTAASKDRGVDVIAERESPFYQKQVIQAKRYGPDNPVSSSEIQQYAGLHLQEDNVDAVVVVTSGRFTSDAQDVATDSNVKLVNGKGLCELIRSDDVEVTMRKYLDGLNFAR